MAVAAGTAGVVTTVTGIIIGLGRPPNLPLVMPIELHSHCGSQSPVQVLLLNPATCDPFRLGVKLEVVDAAACRDIKLIPSRWRGRLDSEVNALALEALRLPGRTRRITPAGGVGLLVGWPLRRRLRRCQRHTLNLNLTSS
jgi:hypothetical protein